MVWARTVLLNDGSVPETAEDALLAKAGARGVIVKIGHLERDPKTSVFLVRFEEELTGGEELAKQLVVAGTAP